MKFLNVTDLCRLSVIAVLIIFAMYALFHLAGHMERQKEISAIQTQTNQKQLAGEDVAEAKALLKSLRQRDTRILNNDFDLYKALAWVMFAFGFGGYGLNRLLRKG